MIDSVALKELREQRFFSGWDGFVSAERVTASEQLIRSLIDAITANGPVATVAEVQRCVRECVARFNELDQGWILTMEREDICDRLSRIVAFCGMDGSAEWIADNREW